MSDAEVPLSISFVKRVPDGDEHERKVCSHCGFIDYVNPKVVVGAVATWEDKILLCKRAIDPRIDYWTLPAGFLEKEETTEPGAVREAWEENNCYIYSQRKSTINIIINININIICF